MLVTVSILESKRTCSRKYPRYYTCMDEHVPPGDAQKCAIIAELF